MLKEHHLTNARTIVAHQCGDTEMTGSYEALYTQLGRVRDWGGSFTLDELESLALVVLDYHPESHGWALARQELLEAMQHEISQTKKQDQSQVDCSLLQQ